VTAGRTFIDANVKLSRSTQAALRLPTDKTLWAAFGEKVAARMRALPDDATIIDLGGGRRFVYAHSLRPDQRLIAIDVSAEELALNPHAHQTIVADVSGGDLPLPPASADLLVSRAVLEHVPDVRGAVRNIAKVLKPGAHTVHLLPARNSLFGMAARILPFKPLLWLLHRVAPWTIDQVEFDVHYDQGTPAQIESAFRDAGFRDVNVSVTWAQPGYFEPLYPIFLLYSLYEVIVRRLGMRRLAAYMIVEATR
jgi:SAM-dependent methyltransferase